jgi:lipopolysaccharide export system protein LptA
MIGDARYVDDDTEATGDTIVYNDKTGDTRISGNAEFRDAKSHARSQIIIYNKHTEQVGLSGRGQITQGSQTVSAEQIDQDQKTGIGIFTGNVVIRDTSAQTILESDLVETRKESGYMIAYGSRRPMLKTIVDGDTLYVTQDTLESYEVIDSVSGDTIRHLDGYEDVRIFKGNLQGLCRTLAFNDRDSIFRMLGDPILWSDTTQFTADTIDLYLRDQALDQIVLRTKAFITSSILGQFYDQISGRRIYADVDSSELRSMHVIGNAESIYYIRDDDQAFIGVNQVVSSEIFFKFNTGSLDQIKFTAKPTGTMTPMQLAQHSGLRLDAFVWRDTERPVVLEDLY